MALMRAKFERCGEPIPMRVDKRDYLFQEDHNGNFVAKIDSEDHVNYLLATGNFEVVETKKPAVPREKNSAEAKASQKASA